MLRKLWTLVPIPQNLPDVGSCQAASEKMWTEFEDLTAEIAVISLFLRHPQIFVNFHDPASPQKVLVMPERQEPQSQRLKQSALISPLD